MLFTQMHLWFESALIEVNGKTALISTQKNQASLKGKILDLCMKPEEMDLA